MAPIRKGDGTTIAPTDYQQIRKGDGTVLFDDIPKSGLLHRWNVSNGSYPIVDSVGSNDLAQGAGGSFTNDGRFFDSYGYFSDGTDDYALGNWVETNTFTVSLFIEPDDPTQTARIFQNGRDTDNVEYPFIFIENSEVASIIRNSSGGTAGVLRSATTISADTLYHVVARYDGSTFSLVIDTVEEDTASVSTTQPTSGEDKLFLGAGEKKGGDFDYYPGHTDFVLFYNRSISDSEIQAIYDAHPST